MAIDPIVFFEMVAAILILALVLLAVIFYLSRSPKLHADPGIKDEGLRKNANLLDTARVNAVKIIDDANNKAIDIVSKVTLSADGASENFRKDLANTSSVQIKEFEKAASDFTKSYFQILQDLKTKNVEVFQNISKDIEINTMEEIKDFKESMQKLTALSQKEVKKKIDVDYSTTKKEIEDYKKEELEKIDSEIYEFLERITKKVLGKALNLSEHEDLITESLEKAKQEGVFK